MVFMVFICFNPRRAHRARRTLSSLKSPRLIQVSIHAGAMGEFVEASFQSTPRASRAANNLHVLTSHKSRSFNPRRAHRARRTDRD